MSQKLILAEIKTLLESVTGIGNVHDYIRSTYFWSQFFEQHQDGTQVLTWEISRIATPQELWNVGAVEDNYKLAHSFAIVGHMSLSDELVTEKTFQDLCDAIQTKFREDDNLNGTILPVQPPNKLQIKSVGHANYAGILVHHAVLTLDVVERVGG